MLNKVIKTKYNYASYRKPFPEFIEASPPELVLDNSRHSSHGAVIIRWAGEMAALSVFFHKMMFAESSRNILKFAKIRSPLQTFEKETLS